MKPDAYERGQSLIHVMARLGTMAVFFLLLLDLLALPFAWNHPVGRVVDLFSIGVAVLFGLLVWSGTRGALRLLDRAQRGRDPQTPSHAGRRIRVRQAGTSR